MKQMKTLLQQLRHCCKLKGRKVGSSLGMVMIVGTALVIWVMAIMPLMTTTGTTALKTQSTQDDYLTARSSIEFSKSELEKIVETQIPYTFAVIQDGDKFVAVPKRDSAGVTLDYKTYVSLALNSNDDIKDMLAPIIKLDPLTKEEVYVLLEKLTESVRQVNLQLTL